MATKKQKREAALAKREEFLRKERERGLEAQAAGRRSEAEERKRMSEMARRINIQHNETVNRLATTAQKAQIEREVESLRTRPDGRLTLKSKRKLKDNPELAELVEFNRGMRV